MQNPLGGLAKKSYYIAQLRKAGTPVFVVDGGNLLFSKPHLKPIEQEQMRLKAKTVIGAYNLIGYDAVGFGPLDFAGGGSCLSELGKAIAYRRICANLASAKAGSPPCEPSVVLERAGVRVGVLGVMDPTTGMKEVEEAGYRVGPLYNAVARGARELRQRGCSLVVVISCLDQKKLRLLAKSVPEVDVYIGGDPTDKLVLPFRLKNALIANSSQLGKYLGRLDVTLDPSTGRPKDMKHSFVAMKPELKEDAAVRRLVDGYYKAITLIRWQKPQSYVQENEEAVNLQHANPVSVGAEECRKCHRKQYDRWAGTKHAGALARLSALERRNPECIECHVTNYGQWGGFASLDAKPDLGGVQCEECHGPGSSHPATMSMLRGKDAQKICRRCHTRSRSPEFRPSEYLERVRCPPLRG